MSVAIGKRLFDVIELSSGKWSVRQSEVMNRCVKKIVAIYPCETEEEACKKVFSLV